MRNLIGGTSVARLRRQDLNGTTREEFDEGRGHGVSKIQRDDGSSDDRVGGNLQRLKISKENFGSVLSPLPK